MVTAFKNIKSTKEAFYKPVSYFLDRIKSGKSKDIILKIRSEKDKEKRNELKMQLPCICWSGEFKERNEAGLYKHSGFICLDFDDLEKPSEKRDSLKSDEYVYSAWISPSGNGVKALIKIPSDNHLGSYLAIEERYEKQIDRACKDVCRVCYESFDNDLWINENSTIFEKQIEITYDKVTIEKPITDQDLIYQNLKVWLKNKGEFFIEGNRNVFLLKLCCACLRYGIPKHTTRDYLMYDFVNGSSNFKIAELDCVVNGAYSRYTSSFNTAGFDEKELVDKETKKVVSKEILDLSLPPKDIIFLEEVFGDMLRDFDTGITKGETTCIPAIDDVFRWIKGELTVLHGIGNHGKSQMMNYLTIKKSVQKKWKWAVFSPEQFPPTRFYNELIQVYQGKSVMKGQYQMSKDEYQTASQFINDHFYYLFPENDSPTPEYILERFKEIIYKKKVDGVIVDPFNQLYHDYSERDDKYLSKILTMFKRFAVMNDIYFVVLAHPNTSGMELKADGNYRMPYYTKISGGAMWGNKCDNILCYHRPNYRTNPRDTTCYFASQKIKNQQINGKPGTVVLDYNINQFDYKVTDTKSSILSDEESKGYDKKVQNLVDNRTYKDVPF